MKLSNIELEEEEPSGKEEKKESIKDKTTEKNGKNSIIPSLLSAVILLVLLCMDFYFRYSFFISTAEMGELLKKCKDFLDGIAAADIFFVPSSAGTIEAYSAVFSVTGVNEGLCRLIIIILEALAIVQIYILSKNILSNFYAVFCVIILSVLPFFGIPVNVYEELAVFCLLMFEIMLSFTRKFEECFPEEGPFIFRYLFVGVSGGLAVFLLPGNLILILISLILQLYYLLGKKRKFKLLIEILTAAFSGGVIFLLLITVRVMNTALFPLDILSGYGKHMLDRWGSQYVFVAMLLMLLFIIELISSLMPGKKALDKVREEQRKAIREKAVKEKGTKEKGTKEKGTKEKGVKEKVPVSTFALPADFVLHRAGKENKGIISSGTADDEAVNPVSEKEAEQPGAVQEGQPEEGPAAQKAGQPDIMPAVQKAGQPDTAQNPEQPAEKPEETTDEKPAEKPAPPPETEEEKAARIAAYRVYAENINPNELEFDFDIPIDDDFDIEVKF